MRRASAFLDAVVLWPREDLDRHLGERPEGPWVLRVDRPAPTLYAVTLLAGPDDSTATAGTLLLATSLFRPAVPSGVRP